MDYSTLKVTELKEELKKRGIPSTKLTRKQDIIDRLVEEDAKNTSEATAEVEAPADTTQEPDVESAEPDALAHNAPAGDSAEGPKDDAEQVPEPVVNPEKESAVPVEVAVDGPPLEAKPEAQAELENTVEAAVPEAPTGAIVEEQAAPDTLKQPTLPDAPTTPLQQSTDLGSEDSRKRKRRSATPPVSQDSVQKKLRHEEDSVVHLEREELVQDTPVPVNREVSKDVEMKDGEETKPDEKVLPMATSDDVMDVTAPAPLLSPKATQSPSSRRFKNLIGPFPTTPTEPLEPSSAQDDIAVSPALHPATAALYIRDLVRPMKDETLRDHLTQLATPPGSDQTEVITTLHIDALRSHAFVLFTSTNAAARARAGLHSRVWPSEPTRRPLWVDFIPEEKVQEWISHELANGGARASQAKRWEVVYDVQDSGNVAVSLVDGASSSSLAPSNGSRGPIPTGPRGNNNANTSTPLPLPDPPSQPLATRITHDDQVETPSQSFLELDKLFRSTATKPKLYYLPAAKELVDKRLDELDRCTSRDWNPKTDARINRDGIGRGLDMLKRYTFEDGDVLVDGGPEYGGGRAFARGGGGGGGESYRGRGFGGGGRRGGDRYR